MLNLLDLTLTSCLNLIYLLMYIAHDLGPRTHWRAANKVEQAGFPLSELPKAPETASTLLADYPKTHQAPHRDAIPHDHVLANLLSRAEMLRRELQTIDMMIAHKISLSDQSPC